MTMLAIVFGIVLLIGGGTSLVHGATQVATRLGVSPMVVGLTVVAFGTSMPELVVNIVGASRGATDLAFGNIVGSNIINVALVLGAAALIRPINIQGQLIKRELPLLLLGTAVLTVMSMDSFFDTTVSKLGRTDGIILFFLFGVFLYITIGDFISSRKTEQLLRDIDKSPLVGNESSSRFSALFILAGVVLLYYGGEVTVRHSIELAERLDISAAIVGLFIVALGTSMPELVTSVIAAARGESDLALGNIVGSNLFNTMFVLPATALVFPVAIPNGGLSDLILSLVVAALLIPVFVFGKARLGRVAGAGFIVIYFSWVVARLTLQVE